MSRIFISMVIFMLILLGRDTVRATQTFRYPLPEFVGRRVVPENEFLTRRIGVFKNVSSVRVEIRGSAKYGEERTTMRKIETVAVRLGGYFTFEPACVPFYDAISLEPASNFELPDGRFEITHYLIKGKSSTSFLVEGDGAFTLGMHLMRWSMVDWYATRPERIREPSVEVSEASLIVEAEQRIGESSPRKSDSFRLPIVFSVGYVNHAWGYQDNGLLIDADGRLFLYDNKCRGPRYRSDKERTTDDVIRDSFTMTEFAKQIDAEQFERMKGLISSAAGGRISQRHTAYDAGILSFTAYVYDARGAKYTSVNLGGSGDFETVNDSSAANTLRGWLQEIRKDTSRRK